MAEMRPSQRNRLNPWWFIAPVALAWIVGMILFGVLRPDVGMMAGVTRPAEPGAGPEAREPAPTPAATTLSQVLSETNLPRQFTHNGMTWQAVDFGRFAEEPGTRMVATGQTTNGRELYYERGEPTQPYRSLYLRGESEPYRDTFVRYQPVGEERQPAMPGAGPMEEPRHDGQQPARERPRDLSQALDNTGLPRQFSYDGRTWRATDFGRYTTEGVDLVEGPIVNGRQAYHEQGAMQPHGTLYLRGESEQYRDTYVMYQPTNGKRAA